MSTRVRSIPAWSIPPNKVLAAKSSCTIPPSTANLLAHEAEDADSHSAVLIPDRARPRDRLPENEAASRRSDAHGSRHLVARGYESDRPAQDLLCEKLGDFAFRHSSSRRPAPSARDLRVIRPRSSRRI